MTTSYFLPLKNISGDAVVLPDGEAHHAVQVLRCKVGDEIEAVDGEGGWYRIRLTDLQKRHARGLIVERRRDVGEPRYHLTVGMALLKNQKRFDVFVEKASELGVTRIVPLITSRTEKRQVRDQRVENVLLAAMKQSGRSRLVEMGPVTLIEDFLAGVRAGHGILLHEQAVVSDGLYRFLDEAGVVTSLTLVVGPEGGFSDQEVDRARQAGFAIASLGNRRLRAETAAIAACAGVMLRFG